MNFKNLTITLKILNMKKKSMILDLEENLKDTEFKKL